MEADLPPPEECLRRCEEFARVTQTNNALAMMYLQDRDWDTDLAISDYFERIGVAVSGQNRRRQAAMRVGGQNQQTSIQQNNDTPVIDLTESDQEDVIMISDEIDDEQNLETSDFQHAHLLRVLSWNIDGLSSKSVDFRTPEVIKLIEREKFHVVCLQEVISQTLDMMKDKLNCLYDFFCPEIGIYTDYFPIICILKHPGLSSIVDSFKSTKFQNSVMGRILLNLDIVINVPRLLPTNRQAALWTDRPIRVRIFTSHLESCADFSNERKRQLDFTWSAMKAALQSNPSNAADTPMCAILCGDLNIRDREIRELGGLPSGMVDVWEVCGARPEAKMTWEPRRNPNLHLDNPGTRGPGGGGMRFDRMMFLRRHALSIGLRPIDFELRGLERVPMHSHFPSDHWAILGHFDLGDPPS